jgi:hypothetical protein
MIRYAAKASKAELYIHPRPKKVGNYTLISEGWLRRSGEPDVNATW